MVTSPHETRRLFRLIFLPMEAAAAGGEGGALLVLSAYAHGAAGGGASTSSSAAAHLARVLAWHKAQGARLTARVVWRTREADHYGPSGWTGTRERRGCSPLTAEQRSALLLADKKVQSSTETLEVVDRQIERLDAAQARIEKIVAGPDGKPAGTEPFDTGNAA